MLPSGDTCVTTVARRAVSGSALIAAAVVWALVNGPVEGPVLIAFGRGHGLTVADLPSVAAGLFGGWLITRRRRHPNHSGSTSRRSRSRVPRLRRRRKGSA